MANYTYTATATKPSTFFLYALADAVLGGSDTSPANNPLKTLADGQAWLNERRNTVGRQRVSSSHFIKCEKTVSHTTALQVAGTTLINANPLVFWDDGAKVKSPETASAFSFTNSDTATHYYQLYVRIGATNTYVFTEFDFGTSDTDIDTDIQTTIGAYLGYVAVGASSGAGTGSLTLLDARDGFPLDITPTIIAVDTGDGSLGFEILAGQENDGLTATPYHAEKSSSTVTISVYALEAGYFNYNVINTGV